jgi:hypothetical protein
MSIQPYEPFANRPEMFRPLSEIVHRRTGWNLRDAQMTQAQLHLVQLGATPLRSGPGDGFGTGYFS